MRGHPRLNCEGMDSATAIAIVVIGLMAGLFAYLLGVAE